MISGGFRRGIGGASPPPSVQRPLFCIALWQHFKRKTLKFLSPWVQTRNIRNLSIFSCQNQEFYAHFQRFCLTFGLFCMQNFAVVMQKIGKSSDHPQPHDWSLDSPVLFYCRLIWSMNYLRRLMSQTADNVDKQTTSFHMPLSATCMLMQFSLPCQLFGSTLSQFVYVSALPVLLDKNVPSVATSVPSMYRKLIELSANKIYIFALRTLNFVRWTRMACAHLSRIRA